MKQTTVLLYSIILVLSSSCDPPADYDYYIINQCNEEITIFYNITPGIGGAYGPHSAVISPLEKRLLHHVAYFGHLDVSSIELFFKAIIIHKGDEVSKVNYVNKNLWEFAPTSKRHANSFLVVTQEVFDGRPRRQWEHETP